MSPVDARSGRLVAVRSARSLLFVPGDRPERFVTAAASGADLVACDLEDAVAPARKSRARDEVARWLGGGGRGCVRINAADCPEHEADVTALTGLPGLVAVLVPKAEHPGSLTAVATRLQVPLIALVETAVGMVGVHAVAAAEGVARMALGHLDYAADLGCSTDRDVLLLARSTLVLASRAAGLAPPLDGVTPRFDDDERLTDDATYARDVGFTGTLLIHPRQVGPAHAAYLPSPQEVAWAVKVLHAAGPAGAVAIDGEMIDAPVLARAADVMRRAERTDRAGTESKEVP